MLHRPPLSERFWRRYADSFRQWPFLSKDYYGGIYDNYGIMIGIAPSSKTDIASEWFVNTYITKGLHTKQAPELQKAYR